MISDLDFADDIALLCDYLSAAQELLLRVETECRKVGGPVFSTKGLYKIQINMNGHSNKHSDKVHWI